MPLFPDEFPFKKPLAPGDIAASAPALPAVAPQSPADAPAVTSSAPAPAPAVAPVAPASIPVPVTPDEPPIDPPAPARTAQITEERRRSPRQALLARALVRSEIGNTPGWKVELLNVSMLGIRFRSTQPLVPGDRAFVKLEVGPLRWATKLRIVHCARLDDTHFAVGCEFIANELTRPLARAA